LDSILLISLIAVQKFVTSDTFNITIVEHEGMLGIPFIILIGIAKSSIHLFGLFKVYDKNNYFVPYSQLFVAVFRKIVSIFVCLQKP
jgi:hypothetical protein